MNDLQELKIKIFLKLMKFFVNVGTFFEDNVKRDPKSVIEECCDCGKWFHKKCMKIPTNVFTHSDASLECNQCIRSICIFVADLCIIYWKIMIS